MNLARAWPMRLIILCLVISMLFACAEKSPDRDPIRIGINPWPGYEFLYLAQEKGFYKELGVDVRIVEYSSLSDVRRGYERGNLDAIASTVIEVLQIKNYSAKNPQIFLITDFSFGGDVIIARNSIISVAALKGKRVAADTASLPIFILARALEKNGLTLSDVTIIPLEQTEMEQAFNNGDIDAAVTYPPLSLSLERNRQNNIIFTSKEIPGEVIDVVSAEASLLQSRRDDFKKILLAWDKALQYTKDRPNEANAIMGKREGISTEEFADTLRTLEILNSKDQSQYRPLLKQTIANVRNTLVEMNVLPKTTEADCCIAPALHDE